MICPLCAGAHVAAFAIVDADEYLRCCTCLLTFLHPRHHLDPDAERARYEQHENDPSDPGYRAFLDRLAAPLTRLLTPGMEGLDYGAGPGPTLSVMMTERGYPTRHWDPFFAPDPAPLERSYDFVTCTETAEHFFQPGRDFDRLDSLLRSPGWLGLMTELLEEDDAFGGWWYVRDPTHVSFYRRETLGWIARDRGWTVDVRGSSVAIFRKPPGAGARGTITSGSGRPR